MSDLFEERKAAILKVLRAKELSKADNVPCQIEKGLYLGSLGAANTRNTLKSLNVTHVLSITRSFAQSYPDEFVHKTVLVPDRSDANISQYFNECFTFIDEARTRGGGVLVHCFAGKSRSVTVIVAYMMFKNGTSLSEAMGYVKLKRPVASPNAGFMIQLQEYERSLRGFVLFYNLNLVRLCWLRCLLNTLSLASIFSAVKHWLRKLLRKVSSPIFYKTTFLDGPEATEGDLEVNELSELIQTHQNGPESVAVKPTCDETPEE